MSNVIKNKDRKYIDESLSLQFTEEDLQHYSGIKIKNSQTECYLKRRNDDNEDYWVKCRKISNSIKEIEIVTEEVLLDRLNADKKNYALVMKG
jgi:hypothetical protein